MLPLSVTIPSAPRVEDTCDFCRRAFARVHGAAAICPNCGLENVRQVFSGEVPETAILAPAVENAMRPSPDPKPRRRGRK